MTRSIKLSSTNSATTGIEADEVGSLNRTWRANITDAFRNKSGWRDSNPSNWSWLSQSGDGNWWYRTNADFARQYGTFNPFEDWATTFSAYFMNLAGRTYSGTSYGGDPVGYTDSLKDAEIEELVDGVRNFGADGPFYTWRLQPWTARYVNASARPGDVNQDQDSNANVSLVMFDSFKEDSESDLLSDQEALSSIPAISTDDTVSDYNGDGVVTPLEALSTIQQVGYVRNADAPGVTGLTDVLPKSVLAGNPVASAFILLSDPAESDSRSTAEIVPPQTQSSTAHDRMDELFPEVTMEPTQRQYAESTDDTELVDTEFSGAVDWLSIL